LAIISSACASFRLKPNRFRTAASRLVLPFIAPACQNPLYRERCASVKRIRFEARSRGIKARTSPPQLRPGFWALPCNPFRGILRQMIPISVQLYTVRDLTAKDFAGTMKQVAQIGYKEVELAGFGNLKTAAEARKALDDAGLKVSGAHAPIDQLEKDVQKVMDDSETLGNKLIICPFLPEARRKDAAGWKEFAGSLNKIARACHERGFDFAYHNHSFEFQKFDGKKGLDILFENTEPHLVMAEIDVYWIKHGGEDPVERLTQLGDRVVSLHLKDMAAGEERKFAEVGTGILDFKSILATAEKIGVRYGAVEQDNTYGKPTLEAIKTSFENLKKMG
jgi:sugar phosphate isomerase/epimerase